MMPWEVHLSVLRILHAARVCLVPMPAIIKQHQCMATILNQVIVIDCYSMMPHSNASFHTTFKLQESACASHSTCQKRNKKQQQTQYQENIIS
jgi:hypothetical protein